MWTPSQDTSWGIFCLFLNPLRLLAHYHRVPRPSKRIYTRESEFAALVREHQAGLWRYLRYLGCERALAEDLVQDTFLAVWKRPFEDRGPEAAGAYLRRVAKSHFLMAVRRKKTRPIVHSLREADRDWCAYVGQDDGASYRAALAACVRQLKPRARDGIERFYGANETRDQVARALGMQPDGVKSLLRRAREALRTCVRRRIST